MCLYIYFKVLECGRFGQPQSCVAHRDTDDYDPSILALDTSSIIGASLAMYAYFFSVCVEARHRRALSADALRREAARRGGGDGLPVIESILMGMVP